MKQVNINGDLIYISDAEYEEMEKQQIIIDSLQEKGWKNEVQKKVRIKIATKKAEKAERKRAKSVKEPEIIKTIPSIKPFDSNTMSKDPSKMTLAEYKKWKTNKKYEN